MVNKKALLDNKICITLYKTAFVLHSNNMLMFPWLSFVENALNHLGISEYFVNQCVPSLDVFKSLVKSRLQDHFMQSWFSSIENSPKCLVYKMYKHTFQFEYYLDCLPRNLALSLLRFRIMNHKLPIEKGRFFNIERNRRICHFCNHNRIGDEFHYLFECTHFLNLRKKYIKQYYFQNPNSLKISQLMNCNSDKELTNLALFCKILLKIFN